MSNRNYSSVARAATISGSISGSATVIPVSETTGFPTVPYTLVLDPGRTQEEIITVTGQVGLNLTVQRGQDGTSAVPHDAGATLRHMATARDFRDSADHITATSGVHGVSGTLVGDIDGQTLDNKTFSALATDHTAIAVRSSPIQTAPLLVFQEPGGSAVLSTYQSGSGIRHVGVQSFQAPLPDSTPVSVRAASGQTSNIVEIQDSSGAILSRFSPSGRFFGNTEGDHLGTADLTNLSTDYALVETANDAVIPMNVRVPPTSTNHAMILRTSDNTSARAGVRGPSAGWQLFHGGSSSNLLPFKVYVGSVAASIASNAVTDTVNLPLGGGSFDVAPLVFTQVRQDGGDTPTRRVSATIEGTPTTTSASCRVFRTDAQSVTGAVGYRVWYLAIQMMPSTAVS